MFFPRLRKQAKWMFVALAVVFVVGFVGLGVGSGSSGVGDLFNGKFFGLGGNGGSGPSASTKKAQKEIALHPNQAQGYRDLATAYEAGQKNDLAIGALEQYTQRASKDQDALRELANLYLGQVTAFLTQANLAQASDPASAASILFTPQGTLGKALGTDPVASAVGTRTSTAVQDARTRATTAQQSAIATYKRLVAAAPNDPQAEFGLAQAAESLGDVPTAVAAYRAMIKLEPAASDVAAVKQHIKVLLSGQTGTRPATG
jgi:tetratricopeptide (TPR) repeat protein